MKHSGATSVQRSVQQLLCALALTGCANNNVHDSTDVLAARSQAWLDERECALSCHTTVPFALASDHLGPAAAGVRAEIHAAAKRRVGAWSEVAPWYPSQAAASRGTESILNALVLGSDAAIANMLGEQRPDGGWHWLDFGLAPWEDGDAEVAGTALAAVALRRAGRELPASLTGYLEGVREPSLHNEIALVWAGFGDRTRVTKAQRPDGSWDDDPYLTAFAAYALGADEPASQRARAWLRKRQRADGSWKGRSLNDNGDAFNRGLATDAATAWAVLALGATSDRTPDR